MSIGDEGPRGKGTFRMVPDKLWQNEAIGGSDLVVWCALCWLGRQKPWVDATDATIARAAKVSARTLSRSLDRIESLGFIRRVDAERGRRIVLKPEGAGELGPRLSVFD
jgi:AraC-like DNA-binding protein